MPQIDSAHTILVQKVLILSGKYPDKIKIWKNSTGQGITIGSFKGFIDLLKKALSYVSIMQIIANAYRYVKRITFGLEGSPDIIGFMCDGKFVGIEIKTGSGKQNNCQKVFENVSTSMNCIYLVVRKLDDFKLFIETYSLPKDKN